MINLYCYENKINGKVYIGQTNKSLENRYNRGHYSECPKFYNALQKYGIHNFDRWIFKTVETQNEANQEEMFWIAEMRRVLGKNNIYNITDGGYGSVGTKHTEETKKKMSLAKLGITLSNEHKLNISKSLKGKYIGEKSSMFGKKSWNAGKTGLPARHITPHSKETKEKLSMLLRGKTWKLINGKRVWQNKEIS